MTDELEEKEWYSEARQNQIDVLYAIHDWVDTHRDDFEISEIQDHTWVGDSTVRRIIKQLVEEGIVEKRGSGKYRAIMTLQSTWFDRHNS